ncbi:MAG: hypothetical protein JSS55_06835 [Proteobacteria bacterium]|nr:hypothetical protein [Pseudomonadota bacterium]
MALLAAAAFTVAAAPLPAKTYTVVIDKMKFGPVPAALRIGDTIQWVNRDIFQHSATARDGSFNVDLPAGKSGATVLKRAGQVRFYCKYHPGMTGLLAIGR